MRVKLITGVTGDQDLGLLQVRAIRVAGTSALAGAVVVKYGSTTFETLAVATAVGVERLYHDVASNNDTGTFKVNMANAGDAVLVFYT